MYNDYGEFSQGKTRISKGETPQHGSHVPTKRVKDGEIMESRVKKMALTRLFVAPSDKVLESIAIIETHPVTR